jgi:HlyD family secretion protein
LSPNPAALATVRRFQSEIAGVREEPEPLAVRMTIFVLFGLLVAIGLFLTFTRVDRAVTSSAGRIISSEPMTVYQALDASIIKSIDVKEGERVEKGQLLATLDSTFAAADVLQLKQQIDSLDAQIARAEAELAGRPLAFPANPDPEYGKYQVVQRQLFDQRAAQYAAQVNSFDQKIAQVQATINKFKADEGRYQEEEQIAQKIEDMRSVLAEHGTGSQLNLLTSTASKLEALRTAEFDHNSLIESQHQLSSLQADRDASIQQWSSTTSLELVTARNSRDAARDQLDKASKHKELVRLVAPEEAMVLTIAKLSVGSVLKEGDPLITLVPTRVALEAEVQIASRDVGFLRPGDPATLKIDAFNYAEHGTATATVRWISEDAFTTDDNGAPIPAYYKARLKIVSTDLIDVPASFRLIPGMTLSADVKVGTRALGAYLLGGVVHGVGAAMREP